MPAARGRRRSAAAVAALACLWLLAAPGACQQQPSQQQQQQQTKQQEAEGGAFLEQQLPLKVLVTTPGALASAQLAGGAAVQLTGRQAITAVFSRPVIALGSDWGTEQLPSSLVPFTLSCGAPGRLRWVTTNIARFDPAVEWPTDLDCTFDWNKELKTFDGAPLLLGGLSPSVRLATRPLEMSVTAVASELASEATDDQWSATVGLPDDRLPEVPPDANITLSFSYPVELSKLAAALTLAGPGATARSQVSVSACPAAAPPELWPVVFTASGASVPGGGRRGTAAAAPAAAGRLNGTCAVVRVSPPLAPGAAAVLRLPAGSRYSSIAGPVGNDTDIQVYGLRPFRIPLSWEFSNISGSAEEVVEGVRYRRLTLWLPHGLAPGTSLAVLSRLIRLCAYSQPFDADSPCEDVDFELGRPTKGTLVLSVAELQPRLRYRASVKGDIRIRDAFGLPLQSSANTWWTVGLEQAFQGPSVNQVALLESSAKQAVWPWVQRGAPDDAVDRVSAWEIEAPEGGGGEGSSMARAIASLSFYGYGGVEGDAFGVPAATLRRNMTTTSPLFGDLPLPAGAAGVALVGSCCRNVSWPKPRRVLAGSALVVRSDLQAAFVEQQGRLVAWVTTTQGEARGVQGARVQVFLSSYGQDLALPGPACTTAADGTCSLDLSPGDGADDGTFARTAPKRSYASGDVKSALVTAQGFGPLVVPTLPFSGGGGAAGGGSGYAGAIVLDRQLVRPGDSLHVTAYLQRRVGTGLEAAAGLRSVVLEVSPGFDPAAPEGTTHVTAPVDALFGSAHAVVAVPANATPAAYSLQLYAPGTEGGGDGGDGGGGLEPVPLVAAAALPPGGSGAFSASIATEPAPMPGAAGGGGGVAAPVFVAGAAFTVADPRPPTATLSLNAPAWARPDAEVEVTLAAASYIGTDVAGANITVEWSTPRASGELELTTNASGVAAGRVDLGSLLPANASAPGDDLSLRATWIGPTREPLFKTQRVKLASGPVRVELERTLLTDLPGVPFGVRANAFSNEDDKPVTGETVVVTLAAANGTNLTECSAEQLAALAQQRCSIKSGDAAAAANCQIALPCTGEFELRGCVGASCGQPVPLGRNLSSWEASPWASAPQMQLLADRDAVEIGGTVRLSVQNPWWGPTAGLLVWGNAVKRQQRVLEKVPPGVSTITVANVGEECRGSCRFVLLLSVARPTATDAERLTRGGASAAAAPRRPGQLPGLLGGGRAGDAQEAPGLPPVPVSKLFDPLAPRTVSADASVRGPQPQPLNLTVSVDAAGAKTEGGVAVVQPKTGKATLRVAVRDTAGAPVPGAEVTMLVVDKSVLDLLPYPLQNVSSSIAPDLSAAFTVADLNALRVAPGAANATFAALRRRLQRLDPWLPADTQVVPGGSFGPVYGDAPAWRPAPPPAAAVDVPDARYLASYTTPLTPLPFRPCSWGEACPAYSPRFGVGAPMMAEAVVASDAVGAPPRSAAKPANGMVAKAAAPLMVAAAGLPAPAPAPAQQGAGAELRLQQAFEVTPVFATVRTSAEGVATYEFEAPDNLGLFVVRAYAATPAPAGAADTGVLYGGGEGSLLVRRGVSLTPSLPRQVRAGDNFTAGVLVEAPGSGGAAVAVTVSAELVPPTGNATAALALSGAARQTVTLAAGTAQQEVRFNFTALAIGLQNISFAAEAAGGAAADRVQLSVPVNGKQSGVWVATSFAVRGANGSEATRVEGLALPRAENGSGSLNLVAGVGYLPAVQSAYDALARQGLERPGSDCRSGSQAVALSVLPSMLSLYRPPSTPPSTYLQPAQLQATLEAMRAASGPPLNDGTYGLLPLEPRCLFPGGRGPDRADVALNAWAAWLVDQLSPPRGGAGAGAAASALSSAWGALAAAAPGWRRALEGQLVADAAAARSARPPQPYSDLDTLSWARLALGPSWAPSGVSADVQGDLSLSRLVSASPNMSVGAQARVGLALLGGGGGGGNAGAAGKGREEAAAIAQRLLSSVRVGGRTAYVATGEGERGAAGLSDQSLALLLFLRVGTDNPLVQKVAAWVGQGAAPPPMFYGALCVSSSAWESALRGRALSQYDVAAGSATPNLSLAAVAAQAGTKPPAGAKQGQQQPPPPLRLLSATFNSSNAGTVVRNSTKWERIPPGSALGFSARGFGEASVAVSLNFTPSELLPFPTYRGLWVQRVVQPSAAEGGSLSSAGLGRVVTVAVQVTSPDDQSGVVVEALMPGGLEPLDPNVYVDADVAAVCSASEDESDLSVPGGGGGGFGPRPLPAVSLAAVSLPLADGGGGSSPYAAARWWSPWPSCPPQATAPAVVSFTFTYFRAGTQTLRFRAVAATSGTFALPPVKAYVRDQPEVMGLSPAGAFTVCPSAASCGEAGGAARPAQPARGCPEGCSGNGACNLATGACICDGGFSGADCGALSTSRRRR